MNTRMRLAIWLCPDLGRTKEAFDMCVKTTRRRLDAATREDNAACAAKHPNGSYGWLTMKRIAPMTAYDFLVDTREELLREKVWRPTPTDTGGR